MSIIKTILNFQNELRLHHWGTKSYAAHKALGKAYESIDALLDTFAEIYMGALGKEELKQISELQLNGPYRTTANQVLNSFEDYLMNELPKEIDDSQTELLNIRDEMLGVVQQTKYLLTLS
jgi:DNA-binding ferritin-like protein